VAGVRVGVIGCGYWGPNLVRTFVEIPEATVAAVADRNISRLDHVRSRYPQIEHFTTDFGTFFRMGLDAVVVSTPLETHFGIVNACLEQGLDVLVEKPITTNTRSALRLIEVAEQNNRILMVGHIGVYNPAVRALKDLIDSGELGEIRYVDAVRVGLGAFHPSLNVVWDLAPHDIAILNYLLGEAPMTVNTRGIACIREAIEDVAYMTLIFPSGVLAHARMSWLDPRKTRRITVVGSKKMVVYDDLESHEMLKVYDKRVDAVGPTETFGEYQFAYHYGSVLSPYIQFEEPLRVECLHFLECVVDRNEPLTDGRNGAEVVAVVEAAQHSLMNGGVEVPIVRPADAMLDLTESPAPVDASFRGERNGDMARGVNTHKGNGGRLVEAPRVVGLGSDDAFEVHHGDAVEAPPPGEIQSDGQAKGA
jgi:predicted dehydrogenase